MAPKDKKLFFPSIQHGTNGWFAEQFRSETDELGGKTKPAFKSYKLMQACNACSV